MGRIKCEVIRVNLEPDLAKQVREAARAAGISMSGLFRVAMRRQLEVMAAGAMLTRQDHEAEEGVA